MHCRDCHIWDPEKSKCRDGKVNPQNWDTTVSVAQVLGLRSICTFNDFRERLVSCHKGPKVREMVERGAKIERDQ